MITEKYRRVYFYHLKKTGGTTMNHWLDTLASDERSIDYGAVRDSKALFKVGLDDTPAGREAASALHGQMAFYWSDMIYGHEPLRRFAPPGTFCFTFLRDPIRRIVSQLADWRRLNSSDGRNARPEVRAVLHDARHLSLRAWLERHGTTNGRLFLDNHMTRALAAGRIGNLVEDIEDPGRLLDCAMRNLETDYDMIGLTEAFDLSRNALCALLGIPPAQPLPPFNASGSTALTGEEIEDAGEILLRLTYTDRILYDHASRLFDFRHRQLAQDYDRAHFETHHASGLLRLLRGSWNNGSIRHSVRDPIIGSGFHGRDGSRLPNCAVWSGPSARCVLYIPIPAERKVSLLVWIRGYVDERQRDQLRVFVDGKPAPYCFETADDYADLLVVEAVSHHDFARLELDVGESLTTGQPGTDLCDDRPRGFAFDSYGWRIT